MRVIPELPDLSRDAMDVYRRILGGEIVAPDAPGLATLLESGLAAAYPAVPGTYTGVDPESGFIHLLEGLHQQLVGLAAYVAAAPGFFENLRDTYTAGRPGGDAVQHLVGRNLVNRYIAEVHGAASKEIISSQPGPRTPEDLAHSHERDRGALERGLSMRTLYHASVRRVANVGEWATSMAEAGAEIRTIQGPFPRSIIFDRRVAFVPVHTGEGEPSGDEAVMITHPLVAAQIAAVFDLYWERADRWHDGRAISKDKALVTTKSQRAILRELCAGRTQKQAAKNLGISSAWINDQMRDLKAKLGVDTLNEVIYWWRGAPDHDEQD